MMHKIIESSNGHLLRNQKIVFSNKIICTYKENLWLDNPLLRLVMNIHRFHKEFKEIYVDQSIHLVDHFIIFISLIDASTRWTQVCLLSTSNIIFARLIAQIIRLRAQFPYYPIKTMRVNSVNILNL